MSGPELILLFVLAMIAVIALVGWLETGRELDREREDEDLAEEHARPHGNVVTLYPDEPCGHEDGWVAGCANCERQAALAEGYLERAERGGPRPLEPGS